MSDCRDWTRIANPGQSVGWRCNTHGDGPYVGDSSPYRLRRAKGPAANHTCVACPSPAKEWAYTHDDPEPLTERVHNGGGKWVWVIYSPDQSRYQPMCVPCHRAFDLDQKRKRSAA